MKDVFARIVSLAPSCTEIILALGAGDRLVAVTKWCKQVCDTGGRPELEDCWTADPRTVLAARPDLVVGSVPYSADITGRLISQGARFLAMNPVRLADVFMEIEMMGRVLDETEAALSCVASLRYRFDQVRKLTAHLPKKKVWAESWPNPLIASPEWVADLIAIAGGEFVPGRGGRKVEEWEVAEAEPDVMIAAWAATGDRSDPARVRARPAWSQTPAVRNARVYAVRDEWLNTPSPILRRGLEALTEIIHPEVIVSLESLLESSLEGHTGLEAVDKVVGFLKERMPHYNWVGVYLLQEQELVLGPYLGKPSPHVRIPIDQGVCGAAVREAQTVVVDNVNSDPRYLACSIETKSEIVAPIWSGGRIVGEIDIDSDQLAAFKESDRRLIEHAASLLGARWPS